MGEIWGRYGGDRAELRHHHLGRVGVRDRLRLRVRLWLRLRVRVRVRVRVRCGLTLLDLAR